ncbi:MAG TPA: hypothetical protein DDX14_04550, partial [Cyanobacteria bacterium UBA9579]|nr:hypothetical protein [Cyanobacteria bacterium UBA9579]
MNKVKKIIKNTYTYKVLAGLANDSVDWFETVGQIGMNFVSALRCILSGCINLKHTVNQSSIFGVDSLLMTLSMVGISGMIIALQIAYEMVKQGAGDYVGMLVTVAIIREIGPIMGSFAVISMVGSSMAAEIGTMKVTEQVDAMKVLGVDPVYFLIVPRVLAGFFIMPFVIILANTAGIVGGMLTSNMVSGLSTLNYIDSVWRGLSEKDIFVSLLKASI